MPQSLSSAVFRASVHRLALPAALVLALAPGLVGAESPLDLADAFTLTADEVVYDSSRDIYEASGDVRVSQPDGRELGAEWMTFNGTTRIGVATGRVRIENGADVVTGEFVAIDLRSTVALATEATLDTPSPGMAVRGAAIQRRGVDTYKVEHGSFTTCRCPPGEEPKPWEIDVGEAEVEVGGYAIAEDVTFRAFGYPIFYLPWLILPAKTDRQSGFLMPSFTLSGRNGIEVQTPFFWAARENVNVILRPEFLEDRGFKTGIDFDYVFGETGYGKFGGAALRGDDEVEEAIPGLANGLSDFDTPFSDDRWALWGEHHQPLARGVKFGFNAIETSDNQYVLDFSDLPSDLRNTHMTESSAYLTGSRAGFYAGIEGAVRDDLGSPDDLDRDDAFLNPLPDVRLAALPRRLFGLPIRVGAEARYTYFDDGGGSFATDGAVPTNGAFFDTGIDGLFTAFEPGLDGTNPITLDLHGDDFVPGIINDPLAFEGDGLFQEGEILADDGHRFDLFPRVQLPARLGPIETFSELGFRETIYRPGKGDDEQREMWVGRFDLRTRLSKEIQVFGTALHHIVEPQARFGFVSTPTQTLNPLFIPEPTRAPLRLVDGDLRVLTENPSDRIADARIAQFEISNRFYGAPGVEGEAARLVAALAAGTGYDFLDSQLSRVFVRGQLDPGRYLRFRFEAGYRPGLDDFSDAEAHVAWEQPGALRGWLRYRYLRDPTPIFTDFLRGEDTFDKSDRDEDNRIHQLSARAIYPLTRFVEIFGLGRFSLDASSSNAGQVGVVFLSGCRCWDLAIGIERRSRPSDTRLAIRVRLAGLGRRAKVYGMELTPLDGL